MTDEETEAHFRDGNDLDSEGPVSLSSKPRDAQVVMEGAGLKRSLRPRPLGAWNRRVLCHGSKAQLILINALNHRDMWVQSMLVVSCYPEGFCTLGRDAGGILVGYGLFVCFVDEKFIS